MNKRVRVNFSEQSKAVTADVTIEYEMKLGQEVTLPNDEILQESKELFEKAQKVAALKTLEKLR